MARSKVSGAILAPARSAGFFARLLKRSKPYLLPLALLDCVVIYYFSLHLTLARKASSLVDASGNFHPLDPRLDAAFANAQAQLTQSVVSLLSAVGGAALSLAALAALAWSARCLRQRRRVAARLDATLWAGGKPVPALVVDLSEGGCRVSLSSPPDCGASVRVRIGDAEASAKVVWRSDQQAGLQFFAPVPLPFSSAEAAGPQDNKVLASAGVNARRHRGE